MRSSLLLLLLSSFPALGQSRPTLVDYPLDVKAPVSDATQQSLEDDFRLALARQPGILLTTRSNWKAAVAALKRQDCDVRDECLRQLAIGAGTLYGLYASLEKSAAGTELTVTGRVVNQDGLQVRAPVRVTAPLKGNLTDSARGALGQLLAKLDLSSLPPVLAGARAQAAHDAPAPPVSPPEARLELPPPPPPPPAERGTSSLRVAAWTTGGLAVVAGGVAAGFGFSALSAKGSLPADGHLSDAQAHTQVSVNQGAAVALGAGIAAGVLAASSIALFAVSAPGDGATGALALTPAPGGATLTVSGRF